MKKIIVIFGIILLNSCGFKVVQNDQFSRYYISQINTEGDNKINYRIKNKIITSSNKTDKIPVIINLETKKVKSIKEKNIKNEITKYNLKIEVTANIRLLDLPELQNFKISKTGTYSVADRFTDTRDNENKLTKNLANDLAKDIKKKIKPNIGVMIQKSFIVENNVKLLKNKFSLFYGENVGLINEFKSKICKIYNNEIIKFNQRDILDNQNILISEINKLFII